MSDTNGGDEHLPKVIAIEPGQDNNTSTPGGSQMKGRVRGGLFERGSIKGFFPSTPPNLYSTSASDSEDAVVPDNNLSRQQSRSSTSLASQSSTLTQRSTGSGSGFRRTRARSSAASTRSSASDRTITNDSRSNSRENLVSSRENLLEFYSTEDVVVKDEQANDNLSDSGIHSKHTDTNTDNSTEGDNSTKEYKLNDTTDDSKTQSEDQEIQWFETGEESCDSTNEAEKQPKFDPAAIAQMVMADTQSHKLKLDAMQHWSIQNLALKRSAEASAKSEMVEMVSVAKPSPAAKPVITSSMSSFKPVTPSSSTSSPSTSANVKTAKSITEELQNISIKSKVDQLHFALSPKEKPPPTKPKPILANSVYDKSFTVHSKDTDNDSNKPRSLAIIDQKMDESWSEDDPDYNAPPLESITEEDEAAKSVSEMAESSNIDSTDTEHEHHTGNQSSSSQDTSVVLKGAMKKSRSAGSKVKSVKFEDEVMMKDMSNEREPVNGHSQPDTPTVTMQNNPYEVKYAETRFIDKSGAVLSKSAPMVSAVVDSQQNGHPASGTAVHNVFVPNVPVPAQLKAQTVPVSPQLPISFRQPPPPYPGNRRQGSQDSTSSRESGLSSSSRGSGSVSWSSGTNSNTKVPLMNRPLPGGSPRLSQEEDDLNSPMNLQKASRQFYQMSPESPGMRNCMQGQYSPVTAHRVMIGGNNQDLGQMVTSPAMANAVEVVRGPGSVQSPPQPSSGGQCQDSPREWYQSDSDSVCSHPDSPSSSLRGSGRTYPGIPGSQHDIMNRNLRNEWLESQNRLVAQQQQQNRNIQKPMPYNSVTGNHSNHGYQNLPPPRVNGPPPMKTPLNYPIPRGHAPHHVMNGNHPPPHHGQSITNGYSNNPQTFTSRAPSQPGPTYHGSPRMQYNQGSPRQGPGPMKATMAMSGQPGEMPPTSLLQSIDPGENNTEEVRYRDTVLQASKC